MLSDVDDGTRHYHITNSPCNQTEQPSESRLHNPAPHLPIVMFHLAQQHRGERMCTASENGHGVEIGDATVLKLFSAII